MEPRLPAGIPFGDRFGTQCVPRFPYPGAIADRWFESSRAKKARRPSGRLLFWSARLDSNQALRAAAQFVVFVNGPENKRLSLSHCHFFEPMSTTMSAISRLGKVVIAGGSGFLGVSLANHLASLGAEVVILSRTKPKGAAAGKHVAWDARTVGDWVKQLDGASALVNLVGRTVDCIKTPDHCDEILRSRVESTQVLGQALRAVAEPPPVWVQMSTAHIYGDPPVTRLH